MQKVKKIFKIYKKTQKSEKTREMRFFLRFLKEKFMFFEENKFTIFLQKHEKNRIFEVKDVNIPKNIMFIGKNDGFWRNLTYKSLDSSEIYHKYHNFVKKIRGFNPLKKFGESVKKHEDIKEKNEENKEKKKDFFKKNSAFDVPNRLYCLCQKPYKEGEKMMGFFTFFRIFAIFLTFFFLAFFRFFAIFFSNFFQFFAKIFLDFFSIFLRFFFLLFFRFLRFFLKRMRNLSWMVPFRVYWL